MSWWFRLTLRARLLVIGLGAVALAIGVAGLALDRILAAGILRNLDAEAAAAADQVVTLVNAGEAPNPLPVAGALVIQVVDAQARVLAGSAGADRLTPLVPAARLIADARQTAVTATGSLAGVSGDLRVAVRTAGPAADPKWVLAAVSVTDIPRSTRALRSALFIADPALLAAAAIIGWFVIGRALRPVEALRAAAERVSGTSTTGSLPVPIAHDEIRALATTLNDMLVRLAHARDRQQAFAADAAHELRSPLASLKAQLEVAERFGATSDGLRDAVIDVDRLARIVDDLLLLVRSDTGQLPSRPAPVDVVDVVREATESVSTAAHQAATGARTVGARTAGAAPIALDLPAEPVPAVLDADHLRRVVVNLVTNAQRHARSQVTVTVRATARDIVIDVDDDGVGIAPADRERVFERFTRLDTARSGDSGGTGLGMPIARQLMAAIGGTVTVLDGPGDAGCRLRCVLAR